MESEMEASSLLNCRLATLKCQKWKPSWICCIEYRNNLSQKKKKARFRAVDDQPFEKSVRIKMKHRRLVQSLCFIDSSLTTACKVGRFVVSWCQSSSHFAFSHVVVAIRSSDVRSREREKRARRDNDIYLVEN